MHVLHQTKQVKTRITDCLRKASAGALRLLQTYSVTNNTVVRELALFWSKPACGERVVGEQEEADDGNAEGHCTFDDKEPGYAHQLDWINLVVLCTYHFQPCRPCFLSSVAKVASAMSPENEVAKMLPEYKMLMRVAISLRV